ncbi:putative cytochrome oxidase assembly protein [Arabidopsis thaliana]
MFARRFTSFFKGSSSSSSEKAVKVGTLGSFGRKAVSFVLITVTGGVALSALDDLSIYRGCSSKAMEKVMNSKAMIEAIGEPIEKGPWYNASLAVSHQRHSVSCSFPVIGPQGTGILHLKAVRNGDSMFGFLQQRDWDILIMDALVHVPSNEGPQQTLRINVTDIVDPSSGTHDKPLEPLEPEKS